jgi:predicted aspartyl protease
MTRALFSLALGLLTASLPLAIGAEDEAQALLAKHKAYVGWEFGDGTFGTMRVETTVTRTGKDGKPEELSKTVDLQRGIVNHLTRTSAKSGTRSDSGFTGSIYWLSNQNGFTIPRLDDNRKLTLALSILFDEATTSLQAIVVRRDTVDGAPVVVLRESIPNGVPLDLYVDPATGAYKRAVADPNGTPSRIDILSYRDVVAAQKAIATYRYAGETSVRTRAITPNVTISDADLHPPAPSATWTFGSGLPFYVDVEDKRIYVDARVNGVPGRFVLDTGSFDISLTASFAAKARVKTTGGTITASGVSGQIVTKVGQVDTIEFGDGSKLHNVVVTTGLREDQLDDGLMGFDFLAGAIVEIEMDGKKMTLYDPKVAAPSDAGGATVVPDLSSLTPVVIAKLNGSVPTQGTLDSGNVSWVILSEEMRGKTRTLIDNRVLSSHLVMTGVSGEGLEVECGQLDSINFGALDYKHVPACFANGWPEYDALLGYDFLRNFNIVFDYPDDKIILFPRKKYQ